MEGSKGASVLSIIASISIKHVGLLVVVILLCAHNNIIVQEYLTTDIANMIAQVMEWIVEFTLHT